MHHHSTGEGISLSPVIAARTQEGGAAPCSGPGSAGWTGGRAPLSVSATALLDTGGITFARAEVAHLQDPQSMDDPRQVARERQARARELRTVAGKVFRQKDGKPEAVCRCGRHVSGQLLLGDEPAAVLMTGETGAHWNGVVSCKSVWLCPVCAARIASRRRDQVAHLVKEHQQQGGVVILLTYTISHQRGDSLEDLVNQLTAGWSALRRSAAVKRAEGLLRLRGGIRALEITHGRSGWHPHLHLLLFLGGDGQGYLDLHHITEGMGILVDSWIRRFYRSGVSVSELAQDWQICDNAERAGEYATKWGAAAELTHGHIKRGKAGSRTPWDILADYAADRWPPDGDLLQHYGRTMKGRRQLTTWGDISLADVDLDVEAEPAVPVVALPRWQFNELRDGGHLPALELAAEVGGLPAVLRIFAFLGVRHFAPPEHVRTRWGCGIGRRPVPSCPIISLPGQVP